MSSDETTRYSVEAVFAVTMASLRPDRNLDTSMRNIMVDDEELVMTSGDLGVEMQMAVMAKSSMIAHRDAVAHFRAALGGLLPEVPAVLPYPIKVSVVEPDGYFEAVMAAPIRDLDKVG